MSKLTQKKKENLIAKAYIDTHIANIFAVRTTYTYSKKTFFKRSDDVLSYGSFESFVVAASIANAASRVVASIGSTATSFGFEVLVVCTPQCKGRRFQTTLNHTSVDCTLSSCLPHCPRFYAESRKESL